MFFLFRIGSSLTPLRPGPDERNVVSRILRAALLAARHSYQHEGQLHFLQDCSSDPGFRDPEKTLSLDRVYSRMGRNHLRTCPSPGANKYARFLLLLEACLAADTFIVAARESDLAGIFLKLNKEEIPPGDAPVNAVNHCFALPPGHVRQPMIKPLIGEEEVVESKRLVDSSLSPQPDRVLEREGPIPLTVRTRRREVLPRSHVPKLVSVGTQTDEGLLQHKRGPCVEYIDLEEDTGPSQQVKVVQFEDHHPKAESPLSHMREAEKSSFACNRLELETDLVPFAASAAANTRSGCDSGFFNHTSRKPLSQVSSPRLIKVSELSDEASQAKMSGNHVKTVHHQPTSHVGMIVSETLNPPILISESIFKEDLCKDPTHRDMVPNPKSSSSIQIGVIHRKRSRGITQSGSHAVKKIRSDDGGTAPIPEAFVLPAVLATVPIDPLVLAVPDLPLEPEPRTTSLAQFSALVEEDLFD